MHKKIACLCFLALPAVAMADGDFWRDVISSGATTASTYMTFKDNKVVAAARDDASSFVASNGELRGPYLEAALQDLRAGNPGLTADDMELASAILAAQ